MPIYVPNDTGSVSLGGGQAPAVTDNYVRPALPQQDESMNQLANSLSKMGVDFSNAGNAAANAKEQEQMQNISYYKSISGDIKEGTPVQVQLGQMHPDLSPAVLARVGESIGMDKGREYGLAAYEEIAKDQALQLDPAAMRGRIAQLRIEALEKYKGNPAYGNGFSQGFDAVIKAAEGKALGEREAYYKTEQEKAYVNNVLTKTDAVQESNPVRYKTADLANLPNLKAAASGKSEEHIRYLKSDFAERLDKMFAAAPEGIREKLKISSGYRSEQRQAVLFKEAVAKYGSEKAASKHVARPGHSNHGFGEATDMVGFHEFGNTPEGKWMHANAEKFGLYFPMSWEPWHVEMIGGRRQGAPNHRHDVPDADGIDDGDDTDLIVDKIVSAESGGNPTAQNPNSTAGGLGQFTNETWIASARKHGGDEVRGVSDAKLIAMKTDPRYADFQMSIMRGFTKDNVKQLQSGGMAVTPGNVYLMHFAGTGGGPKVIKAADSTPVTQVLGDDQIRANPFLRNMSVGELKEWAAGKVGGTTSPTRATHNAVRAVDRSWSVSGGLPNVARRDALVKGLVELAGKNLDPSYLDRMPPELITPQVEAEFNQTRTQISNGLIAQFNQRHALQEQARNDTKREKMDEITQSFAKGQSINPIEYSKYGPEVYNLALERQSNDAKISKPESQALSNGFLRMVELGVQTKDYSKIDPKFKDREPSVAEIEDVLRKRTDIKSEDVVEAMKKIGPLVNNLNIATSDDAKGYFNRIGSYLKALNDDFLTKMITQYGAMSPGAAPLDFEGEARTIYEDEVRMLVKAKAEEAGRSPNEAEKVAIYKAALAEAKSHVQEMLTSHPLMKKFEEAKGAKPPAEPAKAEAPKAEAQKVQASVDWVPPKDPAPTGQKWVPSPINPKLSVLAPDDGSTVAKHAATSPAPTAAENRRKAVDTWGEKPKSKGTTVASADPESIPVPAAAQPVKPAEPPKKKDDEISIKLPKEISEKEIKLNFGAIQQSISEMSPKSIENMLPILKDIAEGRDTKTRQKVESVQSWFKDDEHWQFMKRRIETAPDSQRKKVRADELKLYEEQLAEKMLEAINKSSM